MATIKVVFRSQSRGTGEGSLYYRIIHRRKVRHINTGFRLMPDEWDVEAGQVIMPGSGNRADFLDAVHRKLQEGELRLTQVVAALNRAGQEYTSDEVVDQFRTPAAVVGFLSFARKVIADMRMAGRTCGAGHYTTAINSFVRFNGSDEVPFADFSSNLIQRYESHLKEKGLCPNSTSYYMRILRAIYNRAVEQGLSAQADPFRHVYTGIAKTVKRAVKLPLIKTMRGLDLSHDPLAQLARDLFLFSFYTRGMAIVDMAYLRRGNLRNGILSYHRRKTGQLLSIRWEPRMQEIVDRYKASDSDFLFPLISSGKPDYRKQYLTSYCRLIKRLKKIGEELGLAEPLTFHRSRHSWASIARENNVPLSVICEGMGHDSEKTTRIYLASLDTSIVDKANSDIMRLLD